MPPHLTGTEFAGAFGAVLRNARNRQGLSQEALCEGANIDRTYPSLLGATRVA